MTRARSFIIVLVGLYHMALIGPDLAHIFQPKGVYGYNGSWLSARVITSVMPHSAAADAGLQAGDRVETQYLSLHDRLFAGTAVTQIIMMDRLDGGTMPYPGERLTLRVLHRGHERIVTLIARPYALSRSEKIALLWGFAQHLLRVLLGVVLVLARPGLLTWIFFFWMNGSALSGFADYTALLPAPMWIAGTLPARMLDLSVTFTPALFFLLFPAGDVSGWRHPVFVALLGATAGAVGLAIFLQLASAPLAFETASIVSGIDAADAAATALCIAFLIARVVESRGFIRRMCLWLIVVTLPGAAVEASWALSNATGIAMPSFPPVFDYAGVLVPLFIAYGVLRYQLFDIEFVVSRTLVLALFATVVAGVFAAIDVAVAARFRGTRLELAIDVAVALGFGFLIRSGYGGAIDLVDRLLFFRRYTSRQRLRAASSALKLATTPLQIEHAVTTDAASALGLASAVFFKRFADGGFLREFGVGWSVDAPWHLLPGEDMTAKLAVQAPWIDIRSSQWVRNRERPPSAPAVAIPMRSAGAIVGVTLYGDRLDGVASSRDEVKALVEFSRRAGDFYAFLERTVSVHGRERTAGNTRA